MMSRINRMVCVCLVSLFSAAAARAETVEEVEKKISEQSKKIKSMSMKMKSMSDASGPGTNTKSTLEGTYEYMMDGPKTLSRTDVLTQSQIDAGGNKLEQKSKSLSISDGDYLYVLTEQGGQKYATKMKASDRSMSTKLDDLRQWYDFKLLPDETIDGKPCYALELTPKKGSPVGEGTGKNRHYYQKDTCVLVKAVVFGPEGKIVSTTTYSDIRINPSLGKDRFTFTPPPGVQVQDFTGMTSTPPPMPKGEKP